MPVHPCMIRSGGVRHLCMPLRSQAKRIDVEMPLLSLEETYAIKNIDMDGFKTKVIDCTMPYSDAQQPPGREELLVELTRIEKESAQAVRDGYKVRGGGVGGGGGGGGVGAVGDGCKFWGFGFRV
jgi:hypothetical protein